MQKVLENRCQSCKKSDNFLEKYTSRAISPIYKSSTNLIVREMSKFPILQKLTHMMVLIMMINWL